MALRNLSIATLSNPEFINLSPCDINSLMSKCEIKVCYIGENRNQSYITKDKAAEISKTLRGVPIVGMFHNDKQDFGDHEKQIYIDDNGNITFTSKTVPYGFVSPDSKVWFQEFEDSDDYGIRTIRTYLMCEGYLWTGQYKECQSAITEGKGQSMEFDENTIDGKWANDNKTGIEFFIINDATFTKLCILGDDVEPCFEGGAITEPKVSTNFSKVDNEFKNTLFTMMQDLQTALTKQGGQNMDNENVITGANEPTPAPEIDTSTPIEGTPNQEGDSSSNNEPTPDFKKNDDEDKSEPKKEDSQSNKDDSSKDDNKDGEKNEDEDKKKKSNYQAEELLTKFTELQTQYTELQKQFEALTEFKKNVEDKEKDALIGKFYMLSDEDKKDVIENKSTYSLEDIESKLSVICFRKKVNFNLDDSAKNDNTTETENKPDVTTYNLNQAVDNSSVPAWIQAVRKTQANQNC